MRSAERPTLDDYMERIAERRRETGLDSARRADPDWAAQARALISDFAQRGDPFTTDDVAAHLPPAPGPGALGAAIRGARARRQITCVGRRVSTRPTRHGGEIRVWMGTWAADLDRLPEAR
ncbi:MAG: hypothetical protein WD556_13565 [Actinomycetota bacterium]